MFEGHLKKRVLVVYYSFTGQTRLLIKQFITGMESENVDVHLELLEPIVPYEFPFKTNFRLAQAMIRTFFREHSKINEISEKCMQDWELIVLAGPTWSYHPSGPILDFLKRYGDKVCAGKSVLPFISCRSYWRINYWTVKNRLIKMGASVRQPIVFEHPIKEPYRFIGLFLQLRGKMVRKQDSWFRKHYPGYGHSKLQSDEAFQHGSAVGTQLNEVIEEK